MKKIIFIHCIGFFLLLGCDSSGNENASDEKPSPKVVAWVALSESNTKNSRLLAGTVSAAERTRLSFQAKGQIEKINVNVGEKFVKGQVLASLDSTNYRLNLQQVKANLKVAIVKHRQAEIEMGRREKLIKSKAISKSQLDTFRLQEAFARQNIDIIKAQAALAEKRLADTLLIAPFDGTVTDQFVEVAQLVSPQVPVFDAEANRPPEVSFSIPENMIANVSVGHFANVAFSALPKVRVSGVISEISSQAKIGAFSAKLALKKPPNDIKAGMSAEVSILTTEETKKRSLAIPPSALGAESENKHFVFRVNAEKENDKFVLEKVEVDVINFFDDKINISAQTLRAGDVIVRSGLAFLSPEQNVILMNKGVRTINP